MDINKNNFRLPAETLQRAVTPTYYYDMELLQETINELKRQTSGLPFVVHYAIKANGNPRILKKIAENGIGADLVSGGEIQAAVEAGFAPSSMNYSGVGKTDAEIQLGLSKGINCFNVESLPELEVINSLAGSAGKKAGIAIRVNPDIDAQTHKYITTGTADNKFGIAISELESVVRLATSLPNIQLKGLHFHIGSQITSMQPYIMLCETVNKLLDNFESKGIRFEFVNVGGGLGIDYQNPEDHLIPNFKQYFDVFKQHLRLRSGQQLHFELGRAIVGQCGSLISRVVFVKENRGKKFMILDAGMNDLMRPALYNAQHKIQNLTTKETATATYDVVGPVCESSDVFARGYSMPLTRRGDIIAIRSAGAYGESMSSQYNMRPLPRSVFIAHK